MRNSYGFSVRLHPLRTTHVHGYPSGGKPTMLAKSIDVKEQAMWLAQGYVQGQRDLLIRILEHRFEEPLPAQVLSQITSAPAHVLDTLGPLVMTAPDLETIADAAQVLSQED